MVEVVVLVLVLVVVLVVVLMLVVVAIVVVVLVVVEVVVVVVVDCGSRASPTSSNIPPPRSAIFPVAGKLVGEETPETEYWS